MRLSMSRGRGKAQQNKFRRENCCEKESNGFTYLTLFSLPLLFFEIVELLVLNKLKRSQIKIKQKRKAEFNTEMRSYDNCPCILRRCEKF